jgi:hypothetical protein
MSAAQASEIWRVEKKKSACRQARVGKRAPPTTGSTAGKSATAKFRDCSSLSSLFAVLFGACCAQSEQSSKHKREGRGERGERERRDVDQSGSSHLMPAEVVADVLSTPTHGEILAEQSPRATARVHGGANYAGMLGRLPGFFLPLPTASLRTADRFSERKHRENQERPLSAGAEDRESREQAAIRTGHNRSRLARRKKKKNEVASSKVAKCTFC